MRLDITTIAPQLPQRYLFQCVFLHIFNLNLILAGGYQFDLGIFYLILFDLSKGNIFMLKNIFLFYNLI